MFDCPKCGKANSSHDGERYCGPCEEEYHREQHSWEIDEIKQKQEQLARHGQDCDCHQCMVNAAAILSLQGREAEANALLNM